MLLIKPIPPLHRRHVCAWGASAVLAAAGLAGCASPGAPRVITLSETELTALVGRAFPLNQRVLELLDVQLTAPQLRLLPERNRLAVDLSLLSRERLRGSEARGRLVFDSALRYEPQDASVRLTQVRVQQVQLDGAGPSPMAPDNAPPTNSPTTVPAERLTGHAQRLAQVLAERALEDLAVYRISAERQAALRQWGVQPGAVTVTARGLEITLAAVPR